MSYPVLMFPFDQGPRPHLGPELAPVLKPPTPTPHAAVAEAYETAFNAISDGNDDYRLWEYLKLAPHAALAHQYGLAAAERATAGLLGYPVDRVSDLDAVINDPKRGLTYDDAIWKFAEITPESRLAIVETVLSHIYPTKYKDIHEDLAFAYAHIQEVTCDPAALA